MLYSSASGEPVLRIQGLTTRYYESDRVTTAVDGVDLELKPGEILGIVGESGCGKSSIALSMLNLIPYPGSIDKGTVHFRGRNVLEMSESELRDLRGQDISMIFQDAIAGLNPVLTIGQQVEEIMTAHGITDHREARRRSIELLESMGLSDAERISSRYAFQLSGGMAQRVMIATAMALKPAILIADEPTSALDVTVQAQILEELRRLRNQGVAILLITHDFGVIASMADRVAVMYAGRVVEQGDIDSIFYKPRHPYTAALLAALPRLNQDLDYLVQVGGRPPDMSKLPMQCAFVPRCPKVRNDCRTLTAPPLEEVAPGHFAACYNPVFHAEPGEE
jgi:oligopeptide/dipeptide ABC transporter ATP-binding protein